MKVLKRLVSFSNNGRGNKTPHCTLPRVWCAEIGITEEERRIEMELKNNSIIIKKGD